MSCMRIDQCGKPQLGNLDPQNTNLGSSWPGTSYILEIRRILSHYRCSLGMSNHKQNKLERNSKDKILN